MRRSMIAAIVSALACFASGTARAGDIAPRLLSAQYVALGYDLGDSLVSASQAAFEADDITREDREVMEALRARLEAWDRFVVVDRESNADLVIAVRVGRRGTLKIGSPGAAGMLSSPDDMLSVFEAEGSSIPLWRQHAPGGLSGELPLLRAFRDELEAASPR